MDPVGRIGIDLGGTKTEGVILDDAGRIRARVRRDSVQGDYDGTLDCIADLVARLEADAGGRASVGVGIPGTVSPATNLVKNANSTWLIGKPFDRDLAARLQRPVRVANDADCFALSEARDGAGAGARSVFGVILGTGVGGGIVLDGKLLSGPNAIAGEWGHNPLPWRDPARDTDYPCYCGRGGCIETYLSGPGWLAHARAAGCTAESAQALAESAVRGNREAAAQLEIYVDRLARSLAHAINILDPEIIVLGGGLSHIAALYAAVPNRWGPYVFSETVVTRLVPPTHGASSGVRGAAWLWRSEEVADGLPGRTP